MKKNKILAILGGVLLLVHWGASNTLELYNDGALYRYQPVDDYVGFLSSARALCGDREIPLLPREECPDAKRLCKTKNLLDKLQSQAQSLQDALSMIGAWTKAAKPTEMDAVKWIGAAEKMSKQSAQWRDALRQITRKRQILQERFARQVSGKRALFLSRSCQEELELTLPAGTIDLRMINVAEIGQKSLKISHFIALRNHSGVDISAKDARLYAQTLHQHLRPIHFSPWIVRPVPKTKALPRRARAMPMLRAPKIMNAQATEPRISTPRRLGYRNYAVGAIDLPSTGEEIRVSIGSYEVSKSCEAISYPWRERSVYLACRFAPKQAIESDRWILKKGRRILSENAYGEYDGGKYLLFVDRDDTVAIQRRPLVEKERSSGIFGGKIRRKDGYVLELENKSDRQKTIKIVERIPRSVTDKIKVKLLKIEGAVEESLDDEGKLVMQTTLPPKGHKVVKVLFELSYDKDLKVWY